MRTLKAFTWGYYGWGSESKHFVRAADWMERKRGFLPPVFVDLRFSRGGRAANFKGNLFRDIVGSRRYIWMRKLGNKRIKTKTGKRMQIADPSAAVELFDRILRYSKEHRRVIMFCACGTPMRMGRASCHRTVVADLLLKEAKKRRWKLQLSEWPGEKPISLRVKANKAQEVAISKGLCNIPLGPMAGTIPQMAVLGWGSDVRFDTPDGGWTIVTGPADVLRGQWQLGAYVHATGRTKADTSELSQNFVKKLGYGARSIRN